MLDITSPPTKMVTTSCCQKCNITVIHRLLQVNTSKICFRVKQVPRDLFMRKYSESHSQTHSESFYWTHLKFHSENNLESYLGSYLESYSENYSEFIQKFI